MPAWADYLDGAKNGAEVVPLRGEGFNAVRYGILSRHTVLPHEDSLLCLPKLKELRTDRNQSTGKCVE